MKEKIIFAPGINPAEIQRTLARSGKKDICERFIGESELADRMLIQAGCAFNYQVISANDEIMVAAEAVKDVPYFSNASSVFVYPVVF